MAVTVACVFVRGHVGYSAEYVSKLFAMVRRHLGRPARFVCLTDQPDLMPAGVEWVFVRPPDGHFAWWTKIKLFSPSMRSMLVGRCLYLDLDVLIVGDLSPIIDFPAPLALVPDAGQFQGRDGKRVVKCYNSSCMVWDAGYASDIFTTWSEDIAHLLWGDQDWIGACRPNEAKMPLEWFPRLSEVKEPPWPSEAKVILVKKPKPHIAVEQWPWFREAWSGDKSRT